MRTKLSEAQKRAAKKWDAENLKRFSVGMLADDFNAMEDHIAKTGEPRNRFVTRAIKAVIALDDQKEESK